MSQQRLLVPDCSVMIAASFPSELIVGGMAFDLSSRARPLAAAIRSGAVRGVAPEMLMIEFLKVSFEMTFTRSGAAATDSVLAQAQVLSFQQLPFTWIPADEIAAIATDLCFTSRISPADSWYVACALFTGGELWLSHLHADGLAEKAAQAGAHVRVLTNERFA